MAGLRPPALPRSGLVQRCYTRAREVLEQDGAGVVHRAGRAPVVRTSDAASRAAIACSRET